MLQATLIEQHKRLEPHFKPGFLQRPHAVFQFLFDEGSPFFLTVDTGEFRFEAGTCPEPTLTVYVRDHDTCWGLLDGSVDGMKAFMEGDYRADGNIVLSQLLLYLFKSNDPTIAYEVQY